MFNQGLSLDQAPPFSVILRFFLTLPVFGGLLALALLWADGVLLTLWDAPVSAGVVHLAVLGFAATAMVGALFQMLPVIAGATVKDPLYHSRWIHAFMSLGTLLLAGAFLFETPRMLHPALALLLGSLGFVVVLMLSKLLRVENKTPSVVGMIASLVSLGFGLFFALLVTLAFMGVDLGLLPTQLRTIHMHFMLFGWIATLVMAVAFQVIEMFYVTPPYPEAVRRWFPMAMLGLLVAQVPLYLLSQSAAVAADWGIALLLLGFAAVTLKRLSQRKRPVADATVMLWRTAMGSLALSALLAMVSTLAARQPLFDLAALAFGYFVFSVIIAMTYKIVPFLVWFHLNAKGVLETPMMGDVIPARMAKRHMWLHWGAGLFLAAAPFVPTAWKGVGALLLLSMLLFGYNLFKAAMIYHNLKDKGILK